MTRRTKRSTKAKRAPRAKAPSDTPLIRECVIYVQSIAALYSGFKADPDGNSAHAEPLGDKYSNRARQALTKIASTQSTTPEGLQAKARIVPFIDQDNEDSRGDPDQVLAFLKSFAEDVKEFLRPIVDKQVILQTAASAAGGGS